MRLMQLLKNINNTIEKLYYIKYGPMLKREHREIDDFFMIITFSEMMGIENPFMFYTLDMLPELMPKFHTWHKKMGLAHSSFDNFPCVCCC